jgi:hypothetical protein
VVAFLLASPSKSYMHSCSVPYMLHVFSPINLHGVMLNWLGTGRSLHLMPCSLGHVPEDSTLFLLHSLSVQSSHLYLSLTFSFSSVCLSNISFYIVLHHVLFSLETSVYIYLDLHPVSFPSNYVDLSLVYLFYLSTHVDTGFTLSTAVTIVTKAWNWIPRTFIKRLQRLNGLFEMSQSTRPLTQNRLV